MKSTLISTKAKQFHQSLPWEYLLKLIKDTPIIMEKDSFDALSKLPNDSIYVIINPLLQPLRKFRNNPKVISVSSLNKAFQFLENEKYENCYIIDNGYVSLEALSDNSTKLMIHCNLKDEKFSTLHKVSQSQNLYIKGNKKYREDFYLNREENGQQFQIQYYTKVA